MDKWKEDTYFNVSTEIALNRFPAFVDCVVRELEIPPKDQDKLKGKFAKMEFAKTSEDLFQHVEMNIDEFDSVYVWMAAVMDEGRKNISVAYVFHKLSFKVAKEETWMWFFGGGSVRFNQAQIDAIKSNFAKYHALKAVKQEGYISAIKFTN